MPFKTFFEQVTEHVEFLRGNGLEVSELAIDAGFVRCRGIGDPSSNRGEYSYKTDRNKMDKAGLVGLVTWCRGPRGRQSKHSSYGLDGEISETGNYFKIKPKIEKTSSNKDIASKCRYLWNQAKEIGRSDYLERKQVGAYGIRFQENDYGCVAIIPACDAMGNIQAIQFLNPDGSKRFLKGSSWAGLFHILWHPKNPKNVQLIGIAESYATAATCLELSGLPVVCAFNAGNLPGVAKALCEKFPNCRLAIFADNDRHLEANRMPNQGILKAQESCNATKGRAFLVAPNFGDCKPSKEASDWNDLMRLQGRDMAKAQIMKLLSANL